MDHNQFDGFVEVDINDYNDKLLKFGFKKELH